MTAYTEELLVERISQLLLKQRAINKAAAAAKPEVTMTVSRAEIKKFLDRKRLHDPVVYRIATLFEEGGAIRAKIVEDGLFLETYDDSKNKSHFKSISDLFSTEIN